MERSIAIPDEQGYLGGTKHEEKKAENISTAFAACQDLLVHHTHST